jgi:NAD(P)-dependent dehydrogenase (short-subunit alcohol dehydrogenase family)
MNASKPVVVVTGASTGIGEDCVRTLIEAGFFVFGSLRKDADAVRLRQRFGENFAPLFFDVTVREAIAFAVEKVEAHLGGRRLAGLVNNAGVALPGPLLHQPIEEFKQQFEVNLFGQLNVVQAFAPLLGADPSRQGKAGRIVNMSSVAGSLAMPYLGAYGASKHALEGFSDALRRELMIFGVDVIVIEPGVIRTPIWDKADQADLSRYDATVFGPGMRRLHKWAMERGAKGAAPDLVSKEVVRALTEERPPARIRIVPNYLFDWALPRLLPTRALDWIVARRLGLTPEAAGAEDKSPSP